MTVGAQLATLRKQKGLTQSQFAKAAGISASTVAMYETNRRTPDSTTLQKLAESLNVPVEAFCSESQVAADSRAVQELDVANAPSASEHLAETQTTVTQESAKKEPSQPNQTTFSLTREEARLILFLRMNPECAPFLESYILSDPTKRAQLEKTWRLIKEFQV